MVTVLRVYTLYLTPSTCIGKRVGIKYYIDQIGVKFICIMIIFLFFGEINSLIQLIFKEIIRVEKRE